MKSIIRFITIAIALPTSCMFAQRTIPLFNGDTLNAWYAYQPEAGRHAKASELFSVEDHMIRFYGPRAGYLMSKQMFGQFRLTFEYRWNMDTTFVRKSKSINSGVMYLIPLSVPDTLWPKGFQFQVKEGSTGDFICLGQTTLTVHDTLVGPGRSVVSKRFADAERPLGEWNTGVVTVQNNKVTQLLNGTRVNEGSNPSVKMGRILLMYEGFPIDFRKVSVELLN